MSSRAVLVAAVAVAAGLAGLALGYLLFGGAILRGGSHAPSSSPAMANVEALDQRLENLSRSTDRMSAAIDRLSAEVAASSPVLKSSPGGLEGGGRGPPSPGETPGVARTVESSPVPPNDEHLRELDSIDSDSGSRRRWLLLNEKAALQHFGTPIRVYTVQDGTAEFWEYERGGEKTRTLVFNRGRLIDIR